MMNNGSRVHFAMSAMPLDGVRLLMINPCEELFAEEETNEH